MRSQLRTLALVSTCIVGCKDNDFEIDPNYVPTFLADNCPKFNTDGGAPPDLATPPPKCAAAKGLAGDTLVCVDFKDLANQTLTATPPAELPGWKFDATNCLEIASGKLQVKSFASFVGTCSFTMPLTDLASAANQKYQSVTLAVVQTLDLNPAKQGASAYLGVRLPSQQIWYTTGTNPKTVTSLQIAKAALPNGGTNLYQPLFELTSALAGGATGWQIESIAVLGNP